MVIVLITSIVLSWQAKVTVKVLETLGRRYAIRLISQRNFNPLEE